MFRAAIVALGLLAVLNPFCCCTAGTQTAAAAPGTAQPPVSGGCGCGLAMDEAASAPPASQAPLSPPAPCRHCANRIVKQAAGDKVTVPAIVASGTADVPWEPAGVATDGGRDHAVARQATDPLHGVPPPPRPWTPRAKCALLI